MSKFTLTLNRLHKIVERATVLRDKAFAEVQEAFTAKGKMDFFEMKANALPAEMFKSGELNVQVLQEFEKAQQVTQLVATLKSALIRKNVEVGINEEVARLDGLNKMLSKLSGMASRESFRSSLSQGKDIALEALPGAVASTLSSSKEADISESSMQMLLNRTLSFSYMTEETKKMIENTISSLRIKIDQTNDRIAELNATKIEIDVDASIAVELGLNPQD